MLNQFIKEWNQRRKLCILLGGGACESIYVEKILKRLHFHNIVQIRVYNDMCHRVATNGDLPAIATAPFF